MISEMIWENFVKASHNWEPFWAIRLTYGLIVDSDADRLGGVQHVADTIDGAIGDVKRHSLLKLVYVILFSLGKHSGINHTAWLNNMEMPCDGTLKLIWTVGWRYYYGLYC